MLKGGATESAAPDGSPQPLVDNRLFVLVLQHPQERAEPRATAAMTVAALRRARLVVGLSWPNLARALGWPTGRSPDPRRWGVLYLGSARPPSPSRTDAPHAPAPRIAARSLRWAATASRCPTPIGYCAASRASCCSMAPGARRRRCGGAIPWLMKLQRLVLNPTDPARSAGCAANRGPRRSRRWKPLHWCCAMSKRGRKRPMR